MSWLIFAGTVLRGVYFIVPMQFFGAGIFPKNVSYGQPGWTGQFCQYLFFFAVPNVRSAPGRGSGGRGGGRFGTGI
jgi:hypothetical protein